MYLMKEAEKAAQDLDVLVSFPSSELSCYGTFFSVLIISDAFENGPCWVY